MPPPKPEPKIIVPTPQDVADMRRSIAEALDPSLFANRCGLAKLDPWQVDHLRANPKLALCLCSRQSGKSTVAAVRTLHTAMVKPKSTSVIVCPAERQSKEMIKRIRDLLNNLGDDAPILETEGQMLLELENGSRIIATPGSEGTLRGYTASGIIVLDEAAKIERSTYEAVRPMRAIGGANLLVISTPAGFANWFAEAWFAPDAAAWQRWTVTALDCPRISKEFLAQEEASMSPIAYRQEYLVEFASDAESAFDHSLIHQAFHNDETPDTDYPALNFDWEELLTP